MDDRSKTCTVISENMPMGDELNQLLKDILLGVVMSIMQLVEPTASFGYTSQVFWV